MPKDTFLPKVFLTLFLIVLAFVSLFLLFKKNPFVKESVSAEIIAPSSVSAGERVGYEVRFQNKSDLVLNNVKLTFVFPSGSVSFSDEGGEAKPVHTEEVSFERLEPGVEKKQLFAAYLYGSEGEVKESKAILSYTPEKIRAPFETSVTQKTSISLVPLALTFNFPSKVIIGQEIEFSIHYISTSKIVFPHLRLTLGLPQDFSVSRQTPPASSANIWDIGELKGGSSGEVKIRGVFTGKPDERKRFKAELGVFDETTGTSLPYRSKEEEILIGAPDFFLSQRAAPLASVGAIQLGGELEWEIRYKNLNTDVLEGVSITANLEGNALDWRTVRAEEGFYNESTHSVTWSFDSHEKLAFLDPDEEGVLRFTVRTNTAIPQDDFSDKNFSIASRVVATGRTAPLKEDRMELKVQTQTTFRQEGLFRDGPLPGGGSMPPRVGEKTTYVILWQLVNTFNDVENVKVRGALPENVSWEGRVHPSSAGVSFNESTREIVWDVGTLPALTGVLAPVKQIAFSVSLTPTQVQAGRTPEIIGVSQMFGTDSFTGASVEEIDGAVDTTLPDDPMVSRDQETVRP